jgi:hypothetical protein
MRPFDRYLKDMQPFLDIFYTRLFQCLTIRYVEGKRALSASAISVIPCCQNPQTANGRV